MHEEIFGQLSLEDMYIKLAFDFYRNCLLASDNKRLIASSLTMIPTKLQSQAYTGICDRTLGLHIPNGRTLEGGAIRGQLQRCGLLTAKGGELFRGCVVFPKRDELGHFVLDGMKLVKEIAYAKT